MRAIKARERHKVAARYVMSYMTARGSCSLSHYSTRSADSQLGYNFSCAISMNNN